MVEKSGQMPPDISGDEVEVWLLANNIVTPNDRVPEAPTNESCSKHTHRFAPA